MKKKLTTLLFGLLLAVGWTNVAQAQLKAESQLESLIKFGPSERFDDEVLARKFKAPNRAPKRAQYNITADKTMTRAEYEAITAITYDWVDANGNTHPGTKITEPASNPYQIAYLLGTTYMNKNIPGIKYSAFYAQDHPYPNIEFGWDIPNNSRWPGNSGGGDTPPPPITTSLSRLHLIVWSLTLYKSKVTEPLCLVAAGPMLAMEPHCQPAGAPPMHFLMNQIMVDVALNSMVVPLQSHTVLLMAKRTLRS